MSCIGKTNAATPALEDLKKSGDTSSGFNVIFISLTESFFDFYFRHAIRAVFAHQRSRQTW